MKNMTEYKRVDQSDPEQKKDMLLQTELWQSFHVLAQHWQSDLKFFEDELNFFKILIDKNLSILIEPKNIEQTRAMVLHVADLETERKTLQEQISQHVQRITDVVENPFVQDVQKFKDDHAKLENLFAHFLKRFRSIKAEVFKLNEQVVRFEKMKRLIDWA